jgi:hypothetical protein
MQCALRQVKHKRRNHQKFPIPSRYGENSSRTLVTTSLVHHSELIAGWILTREFVAWISAFSVKFSSNLKHGGKAKNSNTHIAFGK